MIANAPGSTILDVSVERPSATDCDRIFNNPIHPGDSRTYECSVVANESFTNTVTVRATDHCGNEHEETASAEVTVLGAAFVRGDVDVSGTVNLADPILGLNFIFGLSDPTGCPDACDANDDGSINISDMTLLIGHLFMAASGPDSPYPNCGPDPDESDTLDCADFSVCP